MMNFSNLYKKESENKDAKEDFFIARDANKKIKIASFIFTNLKIAKSNKREIRICYSEARNKHAETDCRHSSESMHRLVHRNEEESVDNSLASGETAIRRARGARVRHNKRSSTVDVTKMNCYIVLTNEEGE